MVVLRDEAQDGGIPHLGGAAEPDLAARRSPALRRLVMRSSSSTPASRRRWLIDATPDLPAQIERADAIAPPSAAHEDRRGRPQLLDRIFLTHAHIGHCLGLAALGREVYSADGIRSHGSERIAAFLSHNGPRQGPALVRLEQIELPDIGAGTRRRARRRTHRDAVPRAASRRVQRHVRFRGPGARRSLPPIRTSTSGSAGRRRSKRRSRRSTSLLDATFYQPVSRSPA
ncbi:MAG: MBL fold metallo-hydrolase [Thermoanaerobaculia bacterium]